MMKAVIFLAAFVALACARSTFNRARCGTTPTPPKEDRSTMRFRSLVADRSNGVNSRIKGGEEATPHSLIWNVAMLNKKGDFICGGAIITNQWVITAAICCTREWARPDSYNVRVGAHLIRATNETYARTYTLKKMFIHPNYQQPKEHSNDFCLMKIDGEIEFGPHVGPICLADERDCPTDSRAMVSGWGSTEEYRVGDQVTNFGMIDVEDDVDYNSPRPAGGFGALRQVYLNVISPSRCKDFLGESPITSDMICAYRTGRGPCADHGGPFVQKDSMGIWKLCGVASWGRGCGDSYPSVYARISTALPWIGGTIFSN